MSSDMKKMKEEHEELRRVVQDFVGNQEELKRKNCQRMEQSGVKREENNQAMASDLREEFIDIGEELDQKDWLSIKEQIKSIQLEQGMMRVNFSLKLLVLKCERKNVQLNGQIKKGFKPSPEGFILKFHPTARRRDEREKEHDQKDEAEIEKGDDYNNESENRPEEANIHENEDEIEEKHGRKSKIKNKKEQLVNGRMQSKRTVGEHSACVGGNKGMIRKSVSMYTAFSARFSEDLRHFVIGKPIVFDDIYLNVGNGYDRNSGIFRAPVAGLYLVLMTISSGGFHTPDVEIVKNGSPLCRVVVYTFNTATVGSPCNVLVDLDVGDEVWARDVLLKEGVGIRGQYYSTFSMTLVVSDQAIGSSS
ncbi:hypothetical protein CHS0354_034408 [Potamilus streckersoni]|uniref:C1q domain-containing protein n=1 Tax=Potamilus streckersoni TaxID=2493646 RepID=A0AAE0VR97_9BIVA|nr:hypothetical protein CHS0354_034408 [Potamilus streckersoni]